MGCSKSIAYSLLTCVAFAAGGGGSAAHALPTASMVHVPISAAAVAAEPALANFQTWDLSVTIDSGSFWSGTGFEAILTRGSFYNSPLGGNAPVPQLWSAFPQLRFDTFVTQAADPNDDSTFETPFYSSGFPGPPAPIVFTDTRISINYGLTSSHFSGPGTFTVARLTLSDDAIGSIVGFHQQKGANQGEAPFAFTIPVPEPAGALSGLACLITRLARPRAQRTRRVCQP